MVTPSLNAVGKNRQYQLLEIQAGRLRRHRHQAVIGHARNRVDFEQPETPLLVLHHVGARPALGAHGFASAGGQGFQLGLFLGRQATGHAVLGVIGQVLGVVVVKAVRGAQGDRWQHFTAQHGDGELRAVNPLLDQHLAVIAGGVLPGGDQRIHIANLGHADARAFMGRLDDQREAQLVSGAAAVVGAGQYGVARRGQTQALPNLLGTQLVHGQGRSQDAAAGVGNTGAFEQTLHTAVFAATTVENDKGAVDLLAGKARQEVIAHIDTKGVHASALQRAQHGIAGFERYLALGALATEQHGHTTECRDRQLRFQAFGTHFP